MTRIRSREPSTVAATLRDLARMLKEDYHFGVLTAAKSRDIRDDHQARLKRAIRSLQNADDSETVSILDAIAKVVSRRNPHTHSGRPVAGLDQEDEEAIARLLVARNAVVQRAAIGFLREQCTNSEVIVSGLRNAWRSLDKSQITAAIELIERCECDAVSTVVDLVAAKLIDVDVAVREAAAECLLVHCGECGKSLPTICQAIQAVEENDLCQSILRIALEHFKTSKVSPRTAARKLLLHIDENRLHEALRRLGREGREVRHAVSKLTQRRAEKPAKDWTRPMTITEAGMIFRHGHNKGGKEEVRDAARNMMNTLRKANPDKCKQVGKRIAFHKSLFPSRVHHLL